MTGFKSVLLLALVGYCVVVAALYFWQRSLMYFPERVRTEPRAAGFDAQEVTLRSRDGERLLAWYCAADACKPLVLYFHGNGGSLRLRAERFRRLTRDGTGLLALSYRGYAGSSGSPSEEGLLLDAEAAYEFAADRVPADRIVLFGESLGTGVAVALAARRPAAKLILNSPFASTVELAAQQYPFVPVRWLMKDQFRSDEHIGAVSVPVLVLHGERDGVIPIASAERLFARIPGTKRFIRFPNGGHDDLDQHGALVAIESFLAEPAAR